MRLHTFLNENFVTDNMKKVKQFILKDKFTIFKENYRSLIDLINTDNDLKKEFNKILSKHKIKNFDRLQEDTINEDFAHFWDWVKGESWPALTIFPTLQIWFELDKLFDAFDLSSLNYKKMLFYGVIWIILLTVKHTKQWKKWKTDSPEEYEKENKPGPFTIRT